MEVVVCMKKLISLVVLFALLLCSGAVYSAEGFNYRAEAKKLNDLGLYNGISATTYNPDLSALLDRETGVVMLLEYSAWNRRPKPLPILMRYLPNFQMPQRFLAGQKKQ